MFNSRLGCSSISFRHQELPAALRTITGLGFNEIDLGALPGVCNHVPYNLDDSAVASVTADVAASGLTVRSVNGDIGDLNAVLDDTARLARERHLDALLTLAATTGAKALVLPCGALSHEPVKSLEEDLDEIAAQLIHAAQPKVLLEPRARGTAGATAGGLRRRHRHGLQPHRGSRR